MPDDKEQVTEQQEENASPPTETEEEFSGGFSDKEPVKETKEKEPEKKEPEEKVPKYKAKKAAEKTEDKPSEKKVEEKKAAKEEPEKESSEEEDLDDDELRGKELIEAEEKSKQEAEEKKAKEEAESKAKSEKKPTTFAKIDDRFASILAQFAPMDGLPDLVRVGDRELSIKGYAEDNPEAVILAGSIATNIVQRLIDNGVLITSEGQKTTIDEFKGNLDAQLFDLAVRSQVSNPDKIWDSKEFQEWHKDAKPEVQALFRSSDPMDHVRGFKKFMALTTKESKEKIGEHDRKLAKDKAKHDAIHTNTIRSGHPQVSQSLGESEEEFSEGFRSEEK